MSESEAEQLKRLFEHTKKEFDQLKPWQKTNRVPLANLPSNRFTDRARKVMCLARQEAERFNHDHIGTEHLLLGLVAANVLKEDLEKVRLAVEKLVKPAPDVATPGRLPFTPHAMKALEFAMDEARDHDYVGTKHLLLGLLREQEGLAAQVLGDCGLKCEDIRDEVLKSLGAKPQNIQSDNVGGGSMVQSMIGPEIRLHRDQRNKRRRPAPLRTPDGAGQRRVCVLDRGPCIESRRMNRTTSMFIALGFTAFLLANRQFWLAAWFLAGVASGTLLRRVRGD